MPINIFYRVLLIISMLSTILRPNLSVTAQPAQADPTTGTILNGVISADITLTLLNSPYVVQQGLTVLDGATLSIEPGVVIKLYPNITFDVRGKLLAIGTETQPIVFTSYCDDSAGGDTNGDGPSSGDACPAWGALYLERYWTDTSSPTAQLAFTELRYGGQPYASTYITNQRGMVMQDVGTSLTLDDSKVENSASIGIAGGGLLTMQRSQVTGSKTDGIQNHHAQTAITDSTIASNTGAGALISNGAASLAGSTFSSNGDYGLSVALTADHPVLENVTITNNQKIGLIAYVANAPAPLIRNNTITGNGTAMKYSYVGDFVLPALENNTISGNGSTNLLYLDGDFNGTINPLPADYYGMHLVFAWLKVPYGRTLTVTAGTILKSAFRIDVYGTLNLVGTAEQPAVITDLADDAWGGDTNGDGNTLPNPWGHWGEWDGIDVYKGGKVNFDHAVIRYAEEYALFISDEPAVQTSPRFSVIKDSVIEKSKYGMHSNGIVYLENNIIQDNAEMGASLTSVPQLPSRVNGNTFRRNGSGLRFYIYESGLNTEIRQNIFDSNTQGAITINVGGWGMPDLSTNTIYGSGPSATINLSGKISGEYTVDNSTFPNTCLDITVPEGSTLKIAAGTTLGCFSAAIAGALEINGTAEQPVHLTGANIIFFNNYYPAKAPVSGKIDYLQLTNGSIKIRNTATFQAVPEVTGLVSINHSEISGGEGITAVGQVVIANSWIHDIPFNLAIQGLATSGNCPDCQITVVGTNIARTRGVSQGGGKFVMEQSTISGEDYCLWLGGDVATVKDSSFDCALRDITVSQTAKQQVTIHGSTLLTPGGADAAGLENNSTLTVDAANNWWGSLSGPNDPQNNPQGEGSRVIGPVNYRPWLVQSQETARNVIPLALGQTINASVPSGALQDYQLDVPAGTLVQVQVTPGQGSAGNLTLYGQPGALPRQSFYQWQVSKTSINGQLEIPFQAQGGSAYFFSVYGTGLPGSQLPYTISAQVVQQTVNDFQPRAAGNKGVVTLDLTGLGFVDGTRVELRKTGSPTLSSTDTLVASSTNLLARFDLTGAAAGRYDLAVSWPDGKAALLEGMFTISAGQGPRLEAKLVGQESVRPGRQYTFTLEFANTGDADMPAPLFILTHNQGAKLRVESDQDFSTGALQIIGAPTKGRADRIPPGGSGSIPIIVEIPANITQSAGFTLESLVANDTPVPWDQFKDSLRPASYTAEDWDALWPTLTQRLGATWASYLNRLGEDAQRMRERGETSSDVRTLLDLEVRLASGLPTAAITGVLVDTQQQSAMTTETLIAYRDDGQVVQRVQTALTSGHFAFTNLPAGRYELMAETRVFDPPIYINIASDTDVNGLVLSAKHGPEASEGEDSGLPLHSPRMVSANGEAHMVFLQSDQVYHTVWSSGAWQPAQAVPGAVGRDPVLRYASNLIDGSQPGLALFWRSGSGNASRIYRSIARRNDSGAWVWSTPEKVGEDGAANRFYDAVVDGQGDPLLLWQMSDAGNLQDDSDLYYNRAPVSTTTLHWQDLAGVMVLTEPAALKNGETLPAGTAVGLTEDHQVMMLYPGWSEEFQYEWEFAQKGMVPKYIPYIGGKNEVAFKFAAGGKADWTGATVSGEIGGEVSMFKERVQGGVSGGLGVQWGMNPKMCVYDFWQAELVSTLSLRGRIPLYSLEAGLASVEAGLQVEGELEGKLIWKRSTGNWPDGEVTGTLGLGLYGESSALFDLAEVTVEGSGVVEVTLDKNGFNAADLYLKGAIEARAGSLVQKGEVRWPPAQTNTAMRAVASTSTVYPPVEFALAPTLAAYTGTGNVYGSHPLLADTPADRIDDLQPVLASVNGSTYAFWIRASSDPAVTIGSTINYTVFDGATWSAPQEIPGSLGFNSSLSAAVDPGGKLIVAWIHASADGFTLSSDANAAYAAQQGGSVWYTTLTGSSWSAPKEIQAITGKPAAAALQSLPGSLWVTWNETEDPGRSLFVALWDGSAWRPAQSITGQVVVEKAAMTEVERVPTLVWTQKVPKGETFSDETRLYKSEFNGTLWSGPVQLPIQLAVQPPASLTAASISAGGGGGGGGFTAPVSPPADLCREDEPERFPPAPPIPQKNNVGSWPTRPVTSQDPNEKDGPQGTGLKHALAPDTEMAYTIQFENMATATAPAQSVLVTDPLSSDLDWSTLRFGEVTFGDAVQVLKEGPGEFSARALVNDYRAGISKQWWVDIQARLNSQTGKLYWTFETLDPDTGALPEDALAGFLPPNDATGRGEGHVTFYIKPRTGVPLGTKITNQASIIFDANPEIKTNEVFNTILEAGSSVYLPLLFR